MPIVIFRSLIFFFKPISTIPQQIFFGGPIHLRSIYHLLMQVENHCSKYYKTDNKHGSFFDFRATLEGNSNKSVIINMPFLPVNPDYGTTRNQGRQKLARLESREFNTLVIDVLKEIRRRQTEMTGGWHPTAAPTTAATSAKMPSPLRETGSSFLRDATKMGLTKSLPMPRSIFFTSNFTQ